MDFHDRRWFTYILDRAVKVGVLVEIRLASYEVSPFTDNEGSVVKGHMRKYTKINNQPAFLLVEKFGIFVSCTMSAHALHVLK